MNCPKCNSTIESGAVFCDTCGSRLIFTITDTGVSVQASDNQVNSNQNDINNDYQANSTNNEQISIHNQQNININVEEIDLVNAYIGKNADKLKNGFSFCTLFFGVLYVFYRKMWGLGFIWILLNICLSLFFPKLPFLGFVLNIIISFCFKSLYLNYVSNKVSKIKMEYSRYSKSDLIYICSKKGGTTIVPIIIIVVTYLLITFIITRMVVGNIIDEAKNNANLVTANYMINTVELSYSTAYAQNKGLVPSLDQVKNEFSFSDFVWNSDNTITDTKSDTMCKIIINSNNQMTVECDVEGEKITSKQMSLGY